jgi:hypothetical protein
LLPSSSQRANHVRRTGPSISPRRRSSERKVSARISP